MKGHQAPRVKLPDASFMADGACVGVDPDLFFPTRGAWSEVALQTCAGCAVREQCLEYALALGPDLDGVWAGTSQRQRVRMLRARRAAA